MELEELYSKVYKSYISANGNIKLIEIESQKHHLSLKTYIEIVLKYIKKHKTRSHYALIFDNLSQLNSRNEIINFCQKIDIPFEELKNHLSEYLYLYRPDLIMYKNLLKNFLDKLKICSKYFSKQKENHSYTISMSYYKQMIQRFYESNYTIKRFLYQNKIYSSIFKEILKSIKLNDLNLYEKFMENIKLKEDIKNKTIDNDVYKILNYLKNTSNIYYVDFFSLTNCSFDEIIERGDTILSVDDAKILRKYLSYLKTVSIFSKNDLDKVFFEKIVYNIDDNLIEITNEEKEIVVNYLKTNDIPYSPVFFKEIYFKFFHENLFKKNHK